MKNYLIGILLLSNFFPIKAQTITTVAGGNGSGSAADQFDSPVSIYVDDSDNIYVADVFNNRIQKFPPNSTSATNGITVAGGNGSGSEPNQFNYPTGIFLDKQGYLFVADYNNYRIQKFPPGSDSTTNGITVAGGNGGGADSNQLSFPFAVFVDAAGYLFVADQNNQRIQKFPPGSTSATNGVTVAGGNGFGNDSNQLAYPTAVFVDGYGDLFVADNENGRIQEFPSGSDSTTDGVTVAGEMDTGSAANQLSFPSGLFVDGRGNIYVSDELNNRIQKFPPNSVSGTNAVTVAGGNGIGVGEDQLYYPAGIYLNAYGDIYIVDEYNQRIQKWSPTTGLAEVIKNSEIKLYPNPTTGTFTLETANSIHQPFTIYDMLGNKVWQDIITADKQVVELKGLAAGMYTLSVKDSVMKLMVE